MSASHSDFAEAWSPADEAQPYERDADEMPPEMRQEVRQEETALRGVSDDYIARINEFDAGLR